MKSSLMLLLILTLAVPFQSFGQVGSYEDQQQSVEVEQWPKYPGGEKAMYRFLRKNIKYPKEAQKLEIQGTVYIRFLVDKGGNIIDAEVTKGAHKLLNEEALRVVNEMPLWQPALIDGEPVIVQYTIPVIFHLGGPRKKKKKR